MEMEIFMVWLTGIVVVLGMVMLNVSSWMLL